MSVKVTPVHSILVGEDTDYLSQLGPLTHSTSAMRSFIFKKQMLYSQQLLVPGTFLTWHVNVGAVPMPSTAVLADKWGLFDHACKVYRSRSRLAGMQGS